MTTIAILSGHGRDADPWHDLPATSEAILQLLEPLGTVVVIPTGAGAAEAIRASELIVVNASAETGDVDHDPRAEVDALLAASARGAGVLGVHSSALAFPSDPRWPRLLGGSWRHGVTFHPPIGRSLIHLEQGHPLGTSVSELTVYDERYSALDIAVDVRRLAFHTEDGIAHTLAWTRDGQAGRVAYWGLGHGIESFDDPEHRSVLRSLAAWATGASSRIASDATRRVQRARDA